MKTTLLCIVTAFFAIGCAHARPARGRVALARWNYNHPNASRALCGWRSAHLAASHVLFDWDGNHPNHSQRFMNWTLTHPRQPLEAFLALHPHWNRFRQLTENHRPAMVDFMRWARTHPEASEALAHHPRGLAWAGHHLSC